MILPQRLLQIRRNCHLLILLRWGMLDFGQVYMSLGGDLFET
jgi:hypothetical protein